MRPHAQHFDDVFVISDLLHEPVLDVDADKQVLNWFEELQQRVPTGQ